MAKILVFECLAEGASGDVRQPRQTDYTASIRLHAREITSICLSSDLSDGAMVVAVNPVFYGMELNFFNYLPRILTGHSRKTYTFFGVEDQTMGYS